MNSRVSPLVRIPAQTGVLEGMFELPANARGVVVFAHGSSSSRLSPRNNFVAETLRKSGLGTLLVDLLMPDEQAVHAARFDIALLTHRLATAVDWVARTGTADDMPVGLFGASTGAAAALRLAAVKRTGVAAVVSRGGRPDLAGASVLADVRAPTLLIVGGADEIVLELNRAAYADLRCEKRLDVIPGATHLFEEPGALTRVAQLARDWFVRHLRAKAPAITSQH
jgi:putative phosphoribosyl transferase